MPLPIRQRSSRQVAARAGFTLIELLVVIAIIGIISGITVVGLKYVAGGAEGNQTKTRLEAMKSALAAVTNSKDGARKLYTIVLPGIYFVDGSNKPVSPPDSAPNKTWVAVPASAIESLYRSGKVYKALKSNPEFAAIFNGLNADQKVTIHFDSAKQIVPANTAGADALEFPLDAWKKPILFVFDNLQTATSATSTLPLVINTGGTNVPTGGLTNLYSVAGEQFWEPLDTLTPAPTWQNSVTNPDWVAYSRQLAEYDRGTKHTTFTATTDPQNPAVTLHALRAPDRLPFFFSAGPDGKYQTHDDNVYSFGN